MVETSLDLTERRGRQRLLDGMREKLIVEIEKFRCEQLPRISISNLRSSLLLGVRI